MRLVPSVVLCASLACAMVTPFSARAAGEEWTDLGYRGHFERAGGTFACAVPGEQNVKPEHRLLIGEQPCLYMGKYAIGADAAPILKAFGQPEEVIPEEDDKGVNYLYLVTPGDTSAYIVVTVANKRLAALQISGPKPIPGYSFNGIALGASEEALQARFGAPADMEDGNDGSAMWTYDPWTFSFEVTDGKVTSIRISNHALASD